MKIPRFFGCPITSPRMTLSPEESRHAADVLRLSSGDTLELFDGYGTLATAQIVQIKKKQVTVEIMNRHTTDAPTTGRIVIAAAIAKGERFDNLVTQCTELGVDHIVPVITQRTVKLARGVQGQQRYERQALAACKQSKRLFLPIIDAPTSLESCLDSLADQYPRAQWIFGGFSGPSWSSSLVDPAKDAIAFVGPEGGFTQAEEDVLIQRAVSCVHLTTTILRVETAAIAWATLLTVHRDGHRNPSPL